MSSETPLSRELRARALNPQPPLYCKSAYSWLSWDAAYDLGEWVDEPREEWFFCDMTEDEIRMALLFIAEAVESEEN